MKIICTYCSKTKREDGGFLPAIRRYQSGRILELGILADAKGVEFMILSGEYGLIDREYPLPFYDHLLQSWEVDKLSNRVATTLCMAGVREIEYHTADPDMVAPIRPYLTVMETACSRASVDLEVVILAGNPV